MSEASVTSAAFSGAKKLISITALVNRVAVLENRVKCLEEANQQQQMQIAQLSLNGTQAAPPQQHIQLAQLTSNASPLLGVSQQDAARVWGTASQPMTGIYPAMQASIGNNMIQNPTETERNLVQAIKEVQQQTRNDYPERSLVSQHMIYRGTQDKVYTFKAVCKSAERKGLIEMQANPGGGPAWITLKKET
ncbi:hypothetical protein QFC21_000146 [Naganishia friedmannii]|uniref:Uncharacterized protein n=1 Tax=Naganishia friedmannii TaxID=89922 RepID=A0ACC2WCN0_9TREE|nr:hypothetical protein QFC21_000146 [Naganishia friedmannii]